MYCEAKKKREKHVTVCVVCYKLCKENANVFIRISVSLYFLHIE